MFVNKVLMINIKNIIFRIKSKAFCFLKRNAFDGFYDSRRRLCATSQISSGALTYSGME